MMTYAYIPERIRRVSFVINGMIRYNPAKTGRKRVRCAHNPSIQELDVIILEAASGQWFRLFISRLDVSVYLGLFSELIKL